MNVVVMVFNWITTHEALLTWVFGLLSAFLATTGSLKEKALHLIVQAEKDHPGKPGPEKMAIAIQFALDETVPHLPVWLKPMATPKNVETFLAWVYRTFRAKLEQGAMQNTPGGETVAPPQG